MSLHMVFSVAGLTSCQARCKKDDLVILLGDGVYAINTPENMSVYQVLEEDALIRGINLDEYTASISYDTLVSLCVDNKPVVSWND